MEPVVFVMLGVSVLMGVVVAVAVFILSKGGKQQADDPNRPH